MFWGWKQEGLLISRALEQKWPSTKRNTEVTEPGGQHEERARGWNWPLQEADSASLLVQSTRAQGDPRCAQRGSGLCGEGANRAAQRKAYITFHPLGPGFWEGTPWFLCLRELFLC